MNEILKKKALCCHVSYGEKSVKHTLKNLIPQLHTISFPKITGELCPEIACFVMEPVHLKTEVEVNPGALLLQDKNGYPLQTWS